MQTFTLLFFGTKMLIKKKKKRESKSCSSALLIKLHKLKYICGLSMVCRILPNSIMFDIHPQPRGTTTTTTTIDTITPSCFCGP